MTPAAASSTSSLVAAAGQVSAARTERPSNKEHLPMYVRAAWSTKATPRSKTHFTESPVESTAPFILTFCGLLGDGAKVVNKLGTYLVAPESEVCKKCLAAVQKSEGHADPLVKSDPDADALAYAMHKDGATDEEIAAELDAGAAADLLAEAQNVPAALASFADRLAAAVARAAERYAERDNFISDDDLLDIANDLTPGFDYTLEDIPGDVYADRDGLLEALYAALTPAPEPDPRSWEAVRQTPAFAVALDIARQERRSQVKLDVARKVAAAAYGDLADREDADENFSTARRFARNDNNVLWGAARMLAAMVDNDDELGALQVLRAELDRQDGVVPTDTHPACPACQTWLDEDGYCTDCGCSNVGKAIENPVYLA